MSKRKLIVIIFILLFISAITISIFYYKGKYTVAFETGTEEKIMTQYIKKYGKVDIPKEPIKEGYKFIEWQLNGKKYDFDLLVDSDIILSAKWLKEEYVSINYVTDSSYNIGQVKILKGSSITNLPTTYKDGYEFIGWYLNDELYDNRIINSDSTLVAYYKKIEVEPKYNVGDKVIIVGNYSSSAYGTDFHNVAIGWEREILEIYEGLDNPYMVGNESGVTGFFKVDSIKLKSSN